MKNKIQENKIPQHIGIIMDGNRRWARSRGLPTLQGHKKGYDKVLKVGDWCLEEGVKILSVYAFSTENWNRSKKEVGYLMKLLKRGLETDIRKLHKKNIKVQVLGRIKELSQDLQKAIKDTMELTKNNTKGVLNICINYGGRAEIIDAIKEMIKDKISPIQVTKKLVANYLYTKAQPDPDLIIRTSGEQRLSNFLTWQASYSELYFIKKHWPAFNRKDLQKAIKEYSNRQRRFGG
ncbi:MAG: isoprenyl transferase [Patescibacteria group bacterium]|nr:isoprenyl transferase [Patescibacteria group bacterium]